MYVRSTFSFGRSGADVRYRTDFVCSTAWKTMLHCSARPGGPMRLRGWRRGPKRSARSPNEGYRLVHGQGVASRVEEGRGGGRLPVAMAGAFAAAASVRLAVAPFPLPAHRTGRADFRHPALRLASPQGTRRTANLGHCHVNRIRSEIEMTRRFSKCSFSMA